MATILQILSPFAALFLKAAVLVALLRAARYLYRSWRHLGI